MNHEKTIGIHQPNYFPWLGYFYKIWVSDVFVILDSVAYSKQGYTQSVYIRKNVKDKEKYKLTVPVNKAKLETPVVDIMIHNHHWIKKHYKHIVNIYQKAPFYAETVEFLDRLFDRFDTFDNLSDLNVYIVSEICEFLEFNTTENELIRSSREKKSDYKSTRLLIEIIEKQEGSIYVAGKGSQKYQDDHMILNNGISILKNDFYHYLEDNPYICHPYPFVNGLTILDALFLIGKKGVVELFEGYDDERYSELVEI